MSSGILKFNKVCIVHNLNCVILQEPVVMAISRGVVWGSTRPSSSGIFCIYTTKTISEKGCYVLNEHINIQWLSLTRHIWSIGADFNTESSYFSYLVLHSSTNKRWHRIIFNIVNTVTFWCVLEGIPSRNQCFLSLIIIPHVDSAWLCWHQPDVINLTLDDCRCQPDVSDQTQTFLTYGEVGMTSACYLFCAEPYAKLRHQWIEWT